METQARLVEESKKDCLVQKRRLDSWKSLKRIARYENAGSTHGRVKRGLSGAKMQARLVEESKEDDYLVGYKLDPLDGFDLKKGGYLAGHKLDS